MGSGFVFRHFDKDKSGRLNHQEFKSCLRSLGYDLPMVEEGEPDPEFESILDTVDPNRYVNWTFLYCKIHGGIGWGVGWKVLQRQRAVVVFTKTHVKAFREARRTFVKKKFTFRE